MRYLYLGLIAILSFHQIAAQTLSREQNIKVEALIKKILNVDVVSDVLPLVEEVLAIDPSNIEVIAYRGYAYQSMENYERALKDYDLYQKKMPGSAFCAYRGLLKTQMGDMPGALNDARLASSLSGNNETVENYIAMTFKKAGNTKLAIDYFKRVIERDPNNSYAYCNLATLKKEEGDFSSAAQYDAAAVRSLDKVLFYDLMEDKWIFLEQARINFTLKHYREAIDAFDRAIPLHPEQPELIKERMECYRAIGDQKSACADLLLFNMIKKNYAVDPDLPCDFHDKENQPSKERLAAMDAGSLCLRVCLLKGDRKTVTEQTISYYSKAIEFKPDYVFALANRGKSYLIAHEPGKALPDFDKIIELNSQCAEAFSYRAIAKEQLGDFKNALKDKEEAVRLEPFNTTYLTFLAASKSLLGDTSGAIIDLTKALELNSYSDKVYYERGMLQLLDKKDYAAALKDFQKALEIQRNTPFSSKKAPYFASCAIAYDKLKLYDKALVEIEKAIVIKPENGYYYYLCGEIKARKKDMKGACEEWNKAKQLGYEKAEELLLYNCKTETESVR